MHLCMVFTQLCATLAKSQPPSHPDPTSVYCRKPPNLHASPRLTPIWCATAVPLRYCEKKLSNLGAICVSAQVAATSGHRTTPTTRHYHWCPVPADTASGQGPTPVICSSVVAPSESVVALKVGGHRYFATSRDRECGNARLIQCGIARFII